MNKFFLYVIACIFITMNLAFSNEKTKISHLKIFDSNGDHTTISLTTYTNKQGQLEVRIDAGGIPKLFDKLNPTIGYGRDLDGNGKIDTWFFISNNGVDVVQKEGIDSLGQDILGDLILAKYKTSTSVYLSTATTTALSYLFLTADELTETSKSFYYDWMNLEELSLNLEKERNNPNSTFTYTQLTAQGQLISFGYSQLANESETLAKRDIYGYMAADLGLWLSGGIVIKWGGKLLAVPLRYLSETSVMRYISENTITFIKKQQEILALKFKFLSSKYPLDKAQEVSVQVGVRLRAKTWRNDVGMSIKSFVLKRKLLAAAVYIFAGAASEWKYVALNIGVQSVAESITHYDDILDSNPAIMTKNLFENHEVQQDIGFMTLDTVLMTGLSRKLKTNKAKFMACGLIALHDSSLINFVIKRDNNYQRIALDTSWEVVIGNAQVQADLAALSYFEKLAIKNNNPKIKLIGYAFAIVDQTIGYVAYSKAAELVDQNKNKTKSVLKPVLVPIFVEN
jgi:hypothetical protein